MSKKSTVETKVPMDNKPTAKETPKASSKKVESVKSNAITKKEDKYKESKKVDPKDAYKNVKEILADPNLSIDNKLDKIASEGSVSYKTLIEAFVEFDNTTMPGDYTENNSVFIRKISNLYSEIKKVINMPDLNMSFVHIQVLLLIYKKYKGTSLSVTSYCAYSEEFKGAKEDYQDFLYVMTVLTTFVAYKEKNTLHQIPRVIDFGRSDFPSGGRLKAFYESVLM